MVKSVSKPQPSQEPAQKPNNDTANVSTAAKSNISKPAKPKTSADKPPSVIAGMPWWFPAGIAVAVLCYFGWLHYQMLDLAATADAEKIWERSWMLFVSIEAIALAAAGALLGVQIQRGRVDAAESRAKNAEDSVGEILQNAADSNVTIARINARAEAYVKMLEQEEIGGRKKTTESLIHSSATARNLLLGD